jgi:hypothetical protein
MSTKRETSTRPDPRSQQSPTSPPGHVFAPEYLAWLAERDEPDTAAEADLAGPWHLERDPRGGWAVLRQGETFERNPDHSPTATFDRKEIALLAAAILPGVGRDPRFRLAHDPDDRGQGRRRSCRRARGRGLPWRRGGKANSRGEAMRAATVVRAAMKSSLKYSE